VQSLAQWSRVAESRVEQASRATPEGVAPEKLPKVARADDTLDLPVWLAQITAVLAIVAMTVGRVIAPGLRGSASQSVVDTWDGLGSFSTYAFAIFLLVLYTRSVWALFSANKPSATTRMIVIAASLSPAVIMMVTPAWWYVRRGFGLPSPALGLMTVMASLVAIVAGLGTVRPVHTRAVGFVLAAFGAASFVRYGAWHLAAFAGTRASPMLYEWSKGIATLGVILEGVGQTCAVIWLTTRTRVSGQLLAGASILAAVVITWGVSEGVKAGATQWQMVLHMSMSDVRGTPPPFPQLGALSTFLVATSVLFAAVAVIRPGPAPAITSALALCLIGRGAFDAPLRAFSECAGAAWLLVAAGDERTMWKALTAKREPKPAAPTTIAPAAAKEPTNATEPQLAKDPEPEMTNGPELPKEPEPAKEPEATAPSTEPIEETP